MRYDAAPMASEPPMRPGSVLGGDFEITGPLARGGMGTVYTATQRSTGLVCALKVMHPELLDQERSRERFTREAELCARIESEHVVKVIASGIEEAIDTPWIAMELVEGDDLEKVCRARGAFPLGEAREVLAQLFDAIGAAHAVGVVHRDLKPQNVLVAHAPGDPSRPRVKVLDFGISKVSREQGTDTTAAVGSPLWMAPEQAQRGRLTPATDVFALALMAFRLLTGRMYWLAATQSRPAIKEILIELVVKPFASASARAKELGLAVTFPAGFDAWFERATERDPARRFADARAAWAALRPVLDGTEAPAAQPATTPPDEDAAKTVSITDARGHADTPTRAEAGKARPSSPKIPVLRSPTPTPLPQLLLAAREEREQNKRRSPAFVITVAVVVTLLVFALVVVMTRARG